MARPLKTCATPGCPGLTRFSYCEAHERSRRSRTDEARGSAAERGYNERWRRARAAYLQEHRYCVRCQALGRLTKSRVVDHITPHRGDSKLFWDTSNWQALCTACHNAKSATETLSPFGRGEGA